MEILRCARCGLLRRGSDENFVCEDCLEFSEVVIAAHDEARTIFEGKGSLDPSVHPLLELLADTSFITSTNPHTAIYYKMCSLIVDSASRDLLEISETTLNRKIRTTRIWAPVLKVFEDLGFIEVDYGEFERTINLTDNAARLARGFLSDRPLTEQLTERLSHIYGGYVLLSILSEVAKITSHEDIANLPYMQRPRTLWTVLMFLWLTAFRGEVQFLEGELQQFIGRRGISSPSTRRFIWALQAMDGRVVQKMVKDITFADGERQFTFNDNVIRELERLRDVVRERQR